MVNIKVSTLPIVEVDKKFLKNQLLFFPSSSTNKNIMYLNEFGSYVTDDELLNKLQQKFPTIKNYKTWCDYIESVSINQKTVQNFLADLRVIIPDLYDYKLSNNSIDYSKVVVILKPYYTSQTMLAPLFISIYSLLFIVLAWLSFKKYKYAKIV